MNVTSSAPSKGNPLILEQRSQSYIQRKDYKGEPILRGGKKHKIKFKDENQIILGS